MIEIFVAKNRSLSYKMANGPVHVADSVVGKLPDITIMQIIILAHIHPRRVGLSFLENVPLLIGNVRFGLFLIV